MKVFVKAIVLAYLSLVQSNAFAVDVRVECSPKTNPNYIECLYEYGIEKQNPEALTILGGFYYEIEEYDKAIMLFEAASEKPGYEEARHELLNRAQSLVVGSNGYTKDPVKAVAVFKALTKNENAEAASNLALMYATGNGVAKNLEYAVGLATLACNKEVEMSCLMLKKLGVRE